MMAWSTLGPFLALDNALAALALAPLCPSAGRFWLLTAWFVGVEAAAPIAGALLGGVLTAVAPAAVISSALLMTLGLAMLVLVLARRIPIAGFRVDWDPARLVGSGRSIAGLALVLGVDNLVGGAAFSVPVAAACGSASAVSALMACLLGRWGGARLPAKQRIAASAVLLLAAGAMGFA